jgi:hypothetical protein
VKHTYWSFLTAVAMLFCLRFWLHVLAILAFPLLSRALYFIDDANATILYTGASWGHFSKDNPEYNWTDTPSVYYNTVYVTSESSKTKLLTNFMV